MTTPINVCPRGAVRELVSGRADREKNAQGIKHPHGKACIVLGAEMRPILTQLLHPNAARAYAKRKARRS